MMKRIFFALILALGLAQPSHATVSYWFGSTLINPNVSADRYFAISGSGGTANSLANEANAQCVMPTAGAIVSIKVYVSVAPGTSDSYNTTLRLNTGDQSGISCVIADTAQSCTDTGSVAVVQTDLLDMEVDPTGSPDATTMTWMVGFDSTTAKESVLCGVTGATQWDTTDNYGFLPGAAGFSITEFNRSAVIPGSGTMFTVKYLCVRVVTAVGAGQRIFTVRKNSSSTGGPSVDFVTLDPAGVQCDTVTTPLDVAAGDRLDLLHDTDGLAAASVGGFGVVLTATTAGDFIFASNSGTGLSDTNTNYLPLGGAPSALITTESTVQSIASNSSFTITGAYVILAGTPGSLNKYTIDLREASASVSALQLEVEGNAATTDTVTGAAFTPAADGLLSIQIVPDSTPTARAGAISYLATTASVAAAGHTGSMLGFFGQ